MLFELDIFRKQDSSLQKLGANMFLFFLAVFSNFVVENTLEMDSVVADI